MQRAADLALPRDVDERARDERVFPRVADLRAAHLAHVAARNGPVDDVCPVLALVDVLAHEDADAKALVVDLPAVHAEDAVVEVLAEVRLEPAVRHLLHLTEALCRERAIGQRWDVCVREWRTIGIGVAVVIAEDELVPLGIGADLERDIDGLEELFGGVPVECDRVKKFGFDLFRIDVAEELAGCSFGGVECNCAHENNCRIEIDIPIDRKRSLDGIIKTATKKYLSDIKYDSNEVYANLFKWWKQNSPSKKVRKASGEDLKKCQRNAFSQSIEWFKSKLENLDTDKYNNDEALKEIFERIKVCIEGKKVA